MVDLKNELGRYLTPNELAKIEIDGKRSIIIRLDSATYKVYWAYTQSIVECNGKKVLMVPGCGILSTTIGLFCENIFPSLYGRPYPVKWLFNKRDELNPVGKQAGQKQNTMRQRNKVIHPI